jgi:hypothetical protein
MSRTSAAWQRTRCGRPRGKPGPDEALDLKGRLVQYAGRVLRPHPGKTTAEVDDYHDAATGVLASSLAKRAPGYTSLGLPDHRRSAFT